MKKILTLALLSAMAYNVEAQEVAQPLFTEQIASYQIEAKLDTDAKIVYGTEILSWKNTSSDTISELMFHTYLNAFKNSKSTYFIESQHNTGINLGDCLDEIEYGYIDINRMVIVDGEPLTQDLKYVQTDDKNTDDQTVVSVKLPNKILPGQTIKLNITFLSKLPKIQARTGYERGDFYMVGQWFPKIAVYEPAGMRQRKKGGWNCHQFHYNSEFYADFGTYDVTINVPANYVVGSTGVATYEATIGDGTKTYKFHAQDVIDFAWTASPRYMVYTDSYKNKGIKLMYMPEHEGQVERYIEAVKHTIDYMQEHVGEYPYPQITIVDCPYYAEKAAGMEYPMFVTVSTFKHIPNGIRMPESVTIHEFIHNYFMGVLASNEFEEAWLDEGFTSYFEATIMDKYYGDGSIMNFMGFKVNDSEQFRTSYTQSYNPAITYIDQYVWKYPSYTYEDMAYCKPVAILQTLCGLLGEENFDKVIKNYYETYKFKHPSGRDFINIVNKEVAQLNNPDLGQNLNWFFDSALRTDEVCDYKITKITNSRGTNSSFGIFDNGLSKLFMNLDSVAENTSSIYIQRLGTMIMPCEVLVTFSDGKTELLKWDGKGRCHEFVVKGTSRAISAQLDPENKIALDIDQVNNSYTLGSTPNPVWKWATKVLFWIENLFQSVAFFA